MWGKKSSNDFHKGYFVVQDKAEYQAIFWFLPNAPTWDTTCSKNFCLKNASPLGTWTVSFSVLFFFSFTGKQAILFHHASSALPWFHTQQQLLALSQSACISPQVQRKTDALYTFTLHIKLYSHGNVSMRYVPFAFSCKYSILQTVLRVFSHNTLCL